jgi:hypothetical protein
MCHCLQRFEVMKYAVSGFHKTELHHTGLEVVDVREVWKNLDVMKIREQVKVIMVYDKNTWRNKHQDLFRQAEVILEFAGKLLEAMRGRVRTGAK